MTRTTLAHFLERSGDCRQAHDLLSEVVNITEQELSKTHPQVLRARFNLLRVTSRNAVQLKRHPYSFIPDLSDLRYMAVKALGGSHPTTLMYLACYAEALRQDPKATLETIAAVQAVIDSAMDHDELGVEHTFSIRQQLKLAAMQCQEGDEDFEVGMTSFSCGVSSAVSLLGPRHSLTVAAWESCVGISRAGISRTQISQDLAQSQLGPEREEYWLSCHLLGPDNALSRELRSRLTPAPQDLEWHELPAHTSQVRARDPPVREQTEQWSNILQPLREMFEDQLRRRNAVQAQEPEDSLDACGIRLEYLGPSERYRDQEDDSVSDGDGVGPRDVDLGVDLLTS